MPIFDSHCHLDVSAFDDDRMAVLQRAKSVGVSKLLVPAIEYESWDSLISFCRSHTGLYPALGLHPVFISKHAQAHIDALGEAVEQHQPTAIGEIGLDFYADKNNKRQQISLFEQQLEVAQQYRLPVILHVRKAHDQILKLLKKYQPVGGICHAFNGSLQQAEQYIALNFKLGFGGMLTYERSSKLRKLAQTLPLEAMVLETDAPDMPGAAHQYQRNSPEYLPEVLSTLAKLRKQSEDEIRDQTYRNTLEVLGIASQP